MQPIAALVLAPLLVGIVNRVKALFAGRQGRPLLQLYFDIAKQLQKGAVYSDTSSWVLRAGPTVALAAVMAALLFIPAACVPSVLSFGWDLVLVAYLLGLARFYTMNAALDTGSAFEGMGASREAQFSALAEPAVLLVLAALTRGLQGSKSLTSIVASLDVSAWSSHGAVLILAAASVLIVFLAENSRVPFDDPNTHLELTMVHEAMVLDHGGPDLAFILYGASLKMWAFAMLAAGILVPVRTGQPWLDGTAAIAAVLVIGALTGVVESVMARLRLVRLPQLLVAASLLAVLAFMLKGR